MSSLLADNNPIGNPEHFEIIRTIFGHDSRWYQASDATQIIRDNKLLILFAVELVAEMRNRRWACAI